MITKLKKLSPIARAVGVMGATTALVTGVTFAALQNTATLTGNTINSSIDGLLVDSDGNGSFGTTDQGFAFTSVAPGGESDSKTFKLKNTTDTVMDVNVQVTGESALPAGVDPSDITFVFDTGNGSPVMATWAEIIPTDGVSLISDLDPGEEVMVNVSVKVDASVTDEVSITAFNFTFGSPATASEPTTPESTNL